MRHVGAQIEHGLGRRLPRLAAGMAALPMSKSLALRGLLMGASLRRSVSLVSGAPSGWKETGEDLKAGMACARALGASITISGDSLLVEGGAMEGSDSLEVGESGFLGRVAPVCAVFSGVGEWEIAAKGSLLARESDPLWTCLERAGLDLEREGAWPSRISRRSALGDLVLRDPCSSQELSGLLIGLAACGGGSVKVHGTIPSQPYLEMTKCLLGSFGFQVASSDASVHVLGSAVDPEGPLLVEVDASAAAVALAAGCLAEVRVEVPAPQAGSSQGDWRIVQHLRSFGCLVEEEAGRLIAAGPPVCVADLDLSGEPDLAPVLAVVAAAAASRGAGASRLRGLRTLDGKESARGRVLCEGLRAVGFDCEWSGESLEIDGEPDFSKRIELSAHEDHRMAFAFALLGVIHPKLWVAKGSCISKSWPGFWSSMGS